MNTASQNLPLHLGELRARMEHPTDYEKALDYFLEEFAGDIKWVQAREPGCSSSFFDAPRGGIPVARRGTTSCFDQRFKRACGRTPKELRADVRR